MAFFDYPGTGNAGTAAQEPAADVLLPDASERDWAVLLRHCRRRRLGRGETLIDPGEPVGSPSGSSRSLFLLIEGSVEVLVPTGGRAAGRMRKLATVGPGSVLGEMSFFDRAERSALVRATTPVEVAELGIAELDALTEEDPRLGRQILFDLGRILAQRLRRAQQPT
jgi:SulP family sulfate permease